MFQVDPRGPRELAIAGVPVPSVGCVRAACFPGPSSLLLELADGYIGTGELAPGGTSMWALPRASFRACLANVDDYFRTRTGRSYDLAKEFRLTEPKFRMLAAPATRPFLTKACGAASHDLVRIMLETLRAESGKDGGELDALVLLDATFANLASDREVQADVADLVVPFLRILLLLNMVCAYDNAGQRLNAIKQQVMFGNSPAFCRSVIINIMRLRDTRLSQYVVCGEADYFSANDLTYALDWLEKHDVSLKLWKAMTHLKPPVAFMSFTNVAVLLHESFRPRHRAVAEHPDLEVGVLTYLHAACGPEFTNMADALHECAGFTDMTQFSVTELTKRRAAKTGATVVRTHAADLERRSVNVCPDCEISPAHPNGRPCAIQGCKSEPGARAFQHTTGHHLCGACQIRLTQKVVKGHLNWGKLNTGIWVRYVHLDNTRFEFNLPGAPAERWWVDARGVHLHTNLDPARFGGSSSSQLTLSVQCKLRITRAANGAETAELRLGNSNLDMFPVDMDSFRYTHEGVSVAMIETPLRTRVVLKDGREAVLDFSVVKRGRGASAAEKAINVPFLSDFCEDGNFRVMATSVAMQYVWPSEATRLDRTDEERVARYALRTDWKSRVARCTLQLRVGTLTSERAWDVARVEYIAANAAESGGAKAKRARVEAMA